MTPIASRIARAPKERLAAVIWPQRLVVERHGVPHGLVHQLRQLYGVGRRARASALEGAGLRSELHLVADAVGDVAQVAQGA